MRSEGIDRQAAFERLRQRARTQRRKLEELARTIIEQKQPSAQ
jgi:AmiR/NasT family two-component response regulator